MKASITQITEGQKKQYKQFKELSVTNKYANDELDPNYGCGYGYHSGYKPKGIAEQIKTLRKFLPGVGIADESIIIKPFPAVAEGWFAIPRYELVAASYNKAVKKVLELIKKDHKGNFYNWFEGNIGPQYLHPQYLRQTECSVRFWKKLGEEQNGHDILIVPAQFGLRHRIRSVRRARVVMNSSEFWLGVFAVSVMLLTHPMRLKHHLDLMIDCAGDKYSPDANGVFSHAPIFYFREGRVWIDACQVNRVYGDGGSASGFV